MSIFLNYVDISIMEKKNSKDIRAFTQYCWFSNSIEIKAFSYLYLRVSRNLTSSENFSPFNSEIVSFSVNITSLGLSMVYNFIVSFQLQRLKYES